jgi:hypothetical protein
MPLIQRIGFTIFSLMFCLCGLWLCKGFAGTFRDRNPACVFFGLGGAFFLWFGVLGLRNVLRFRPNR